MDWTARCGLLGAGLALDGHLWWLDFDGEGFGREQCREVGRWKNFFIGSDDCGVNGVRGCKALVSEGNIGDAACSC